MWLRWTGQQLILSLMVQFTCKFAAFNWETTYICTYMYVMPWNESVIPVTYIHT